MYIEEGKERVNGTERTRRYGRRGSGMGVAGGAVGVGDGREGREADWARKRVGSGILGQSGQASSIQEDLVEWDLAFAKIQGKFADGRMGRRTCGSLGRNEVIPKVEFLEDLLDVGSLLLEGGVEVRP